MFNAHTYHVDQVPCLLNCSPGEVTTTLATLTPADHPHVALSVGLHPWQVGDDWAAQVEQLRQDVQHECVWAVGECGLDKVKGAPLSIQAEAFQAQIAIAEAVGKPMVIHCVRAFDELLALRRQLVDTCRRQGTQPQPWMIHGFRGKPEQAQQLMAKGLLLSFGHRYHVETLQCVFQYAQSETLGVIHPFFLETDDLPLSIRQIYEQVARHLGVDVARLESLCDPSHLFPQNPL